MANNYRQFSEMLLSLTKREKKWLETALDGKSTIFNSRLKQEGIEDFPNFDWDFLPEGFWLYSEEGGDIDHVALLVQEFLKRFRPNHWFGLTWADTCSKPRIGEFDGGYLFVTHDTIQADCASNRLLKLVQAAFPHQMKGAL